MRVTDLYKNTNVFYGRNVKQISYNSLEYLVFLSTTLLLTGTSKITLKKFDKSVMLFQNYAFYLHMTVFDNITFSEC